MVDSFSRAVCAHFDRLLVGTEIHGAEHDPIWPDDDVRFAGTSDLSTAMMLSGLIVWATCTGINAKRPAPSENWPSS
jgi:hypothetical protein